MPRRILLADDSVTAQNMGKKILSDAGYEVITVSNGSAALKKANELLPDIAVLDVYMPGYSGLEVCKQLKDNPKTAEIPVLLTVGKLEPFKSEEALKARANAFIVKPFEATELLAVIRKIEDANAKAATKSSKTAKVSTLAKVFASSTAVEEPDPDAGIEEKGWKNRLSMPGKRKAEAEPEQEDSATVMGTGFRDLTVAEESPLRRESAFTADPVEAPAPEAVAVKAPVGATVDISPQEIAAIKAAVEILSGEGDRAPVLHIPAHIPAAEGVSRQLAPEPEEAPEDLPIQPVPEVAQIHEPPHAVELTLVAAAEQGAASAESITPNLAQNRVVEPVRAHWIAEPVELTRTDAAALLEQEMREALGTPSETFNTYSLASFAESAAPVDDEPIVSEVTAQMSLQSAVLAVAAGASGEGSAVSESGFATAASAASATAGVSTGFQDLHATGQSPATVEGMASPAMTVDAMPSAAPHDRPPRDPSAPDDEIDSRTKSQMDAAWSNWREIRNTIVTPNLTEQLAEVAAETAKEGMEPQAASSAGAGYDSASIANIVDSVLAEMRPKLVEEIARKLAAKRE